MREDQIKKQSLEVTGLGMIACVIIASGSLVVDGSLDLSHFLVFSGFLLLSAIGLVWRLLSPTPIDKANAGE